MNINPVNAGSNWWMVCKVFGFCIHVLTPALIFVNVYIVYLCMCGLWIVLKNTLSDSPMSLEEECGGLSSCNRSTCWCHL